MCVWRWRGQGGHWLRVILHSVQTQPRHYISYLEPIGRGSGGHVIVFAPRRVDGVKRNAVRATGPNLLFFPYHFVPVVLIICSVALAQQTPMHISPYIVYDGNNSSNSRFIRSRRRKEKRAG